MTTPFVGRGNAMDLGLPTPWPWIPDEDEPPILDESAPGHPAGYFAGEELVDAVNTALLLGKPLLLTGRPGTGKTDLAQRIAWEFGLGPVLRFEAQSLSEANDLFYRFDLVRHVAASHTARPAEHGEPASADPRRFISFGPLGKAVLRNHPHHPDHQSVWHRAFPDQPVPQSGQRSVVLIDEIDKASRDFPNDLLNAIERLRVPLRDLGDRQHLTVDKERPDLRPIVIVTSNLERDLPDPFLRRCVFFDIADPTPDILRRIVKARVFPESLKPGAPPWLPADDRLPPLFEELLGFFIWQRDEASVAAVYRNGPTELIDWCLAIRASVPRVDAVPPPFDQGIRQHLLLVRRAFGALTKHRDDRRALLGAFDRRYAGA